MPNGEKDSAWWSMGLVNWHITGGKEEARWGGCIVAKYWIVSRLEGNRNRKLECR